MAALTETSKWLDPLLSAAPAFLLAKLAPAVDFNIVAGLNYVCNITLRIYLKDWNDKFSKSFNFFVSIFRFNINS